MRMLAAQTDPALAGNEKKREDNASNNSNIQNIFCSDVELFDLWLLSV